MPQRRTFILLALAVLFLTGSLFWWFVHYQKSQAFVVESPALVQEEIATQVGEAPRIEDKDTELKEVPKETAPQQVSEKTKDDEQKTTTPKGVVQKLVSFGYEEASGRKINTMVLHSSHAVSGDPYDTGAVIALWKSYGVAPHYMVARDGTVYQLVADKNIAYHAGEGQMPDGRSGVNNFSIGVEILNTKTDDYTSAQYSAVKSLIARLEGKYGNLKVVGHDTIAPGRKTDPWNFNWDKI
jgi:N-acetyl-anhydromuramyl-L-alanine amidase AmpD